MSYSLSQLTRIEQGLCYACGKPRTREGSRALCPDCNIKRRVKQAERRTERKGKKLCISCGRPITNKSTKCAQCLKRAMEYFHNIKKRWVVQGLCVACGKTPMPSMAKKNLWRLCETCYLKKRARMRLGNGQHWVAIKEKLIAQNFQCAYTGAQIILGVNDSLDHIYPVHKFPNLKSDLHNVEWITREINEMKGDRTPGEFLSVIQHILNYQHNGTSVL